MVLKVDLTVIMVPKAVAKARKLLSIFRRARGLEGPLGILRREIGP